MSILIMCFIFLPRPPRSIQKQQSPALLLDLSHPCYCTFAHLTLGLRGWHRPTFLLLTKLRELSMSSKKRIPQGRMREVERERDVCSQWHYLIIEHNNHLQSRYPQERHTKINMPAVKYSSAAGRVFFPKKKNLNRFNKNRKHMSEFIPRD